MKRKEFTNLYAGLVSELSVAKLRGELEIYEDEEDIDAIIELIMQTNDYIQRFLSSKDAYKTYTNSKYVQRYFAEVVSFQKECSDAIKRIKEDL